MATVIYIKEKRQSPGAMRGVIAYCAQEMKTVDALGRRYLSGVNCTGENALQEFLLTKEAYHKTDGMNFYQYVQSFSPDESITFAQAHVIALEFAARAWPGYEVLVATHCDAAHPHSHFVINSVSFDNGKKLRQHPDTLAHLRALSDEICAAHGFSVIKTDSESKQKDTQKMSAREYRSADKGESWKLALAIQVEDAMADARSKEEFVLLMGAEGYGVTWTPERKYITYQCPNGRKCRDNKLHETKFTKEAMEHEFRIREALTRGIESAGAAGTAGTAGRRKRRSLRGRDGAELEGVAGFGTAPQRTASDAASADRFADDGGRNEQPDRMADGSALRSADGNGNTDGNVSGEADSGSGSIYEVGADGSLRFVETGWERERSVWLGLAGGAQKDAPVYDPVVLDLADSNGGHPALGAGLGALASVGSLLDDDGEDPETKRRRREAEQNGSNIGAIFGTVAGLIGLAADAHLEKQAPEEPADESVETADETPNMAL